jgi:hypothetical protein
MAYGPQKEMKECHPNSPDLWQILSLVLRNIIAAWLLWQEIEQF